MGSNFATPMTAGIGYLIGSFIVLVFNTYVAPALGVVPMGTMLQTAVTGICVYVAAWVLPPHNRAPTELKLPPTNG